MYYFGFGYENGVMSFFLLSSLLAWNINFSMDRGYLNEPSSSV
jgi:hypothetical protein